jgi:hypothetical protein
MYETRRKIRVEQFKKFIDSLPYRNHDYLKQAVENWTIDQIDQLEQLILS